jgi:hypothetical protein
MTPPDDFLEFNYPPVRQFTDTVRLDRGCHFVRALFKVDVTDALQKIKNLRAPGRKVSFPPRTALAGRPEALNQKRDSIAESLFVIWINSISWSGS